jgi:transposase, IS5 family
MSRRDLCQPSFVDAMVSGCGRRGGFLDRIEQAFDWWAFEALLAPIHASTRGAPGYPPLTMLKISLLQQWHRLSDPGAEEAVRDRLSFRRFCGLPLEADTPDTPRSGASARRSTSSAFRRRCFRRRTGNSTRSVSS